MLLPRLLSNAHLIDRPPQLPFSEKLHLFILYVYGGGGTCSSPYVGGRGQLDSTTSPLDSTTWVPRVVLRSSSKYLKLRSHLAGLHLCFLNSWGPRYAMPCPELPSCKLLMKVMEKCIHSLCIIKYFKTLSMYVVFIAVVSHV